MSQLPPVGATIPRLRLYTRRRVLQVWAVVTSRRGLPASSHCRERMCCLSGSRGGPAPPSHGAECWRKRHFSNVQSGAVQQHERQPEADVESGEHREIAQLWKQLEPAVQAIANGYLPLLDSALLHELVTRFNEHVRIEEEQFLPFAQQVLARQAEDIAMLGLALHRRHEAEEIMSTAVVYGPT